MSTLNIINRLINAGMSVNGALGMWGNIDKESGGRANNAENGHSQYDDETYTRYVDEGRLGFIYDQTGFGLSQWTFWSRKQALLDFAKARGVSIGDENMQVDFLVKEMKEKYPAVWKACCDPNISIYDATSIVCEQYEKPREDTTDERYQLAIDAYNKYKNQLNGHIDVEPEKPKEDTSDEAQAMPTLKRGIKGETVAVAMMQIGLKYHGFWVYPLESWADGDFGSNTESKLKQFQQKNGLEVDGICGKQTWAKLLKTKG